MDIAEREAKILVYRGDNWEPAPPAVAEPEESKESTEQTESKETPKEGEQAPAQQQSETTSTQ